MHSLRTECNRRPTLFSVKGTCCVTEESSRHSPTKSLEQLEGVGRRTNAHVQADLPCLSSELRIRQCAVQAVECAPFQKSHAVHSQNRSKFSPRQQLGNGTETDRMTLVTETAATPSHESYETFMKLRRGGTQSCNCSRPFTAGRRL